jgi:hypothetical protein
MTGWCFPQSGIPASSYSARAGHRPPFGKKARHLGSVSWSLDTTYAISVTTTSRFGDTFFTALKTYTSAWP